jgi:DNA-binding XRE family transcriptional regulator
MPNPPGLLLEVQRALGLSQREVGELIGVSRRTMVRWNNGGMGPIASEWCELARHVYPVDAVLAATLAKQAGETLESLRLVAPPASPPLLLPLPKAPTVTNSDLVDLAVLSAAEALSMPPQAVRPALVAAVDRMTACGLTLEAAREVMHPPAPAANDKAKKAKKG